MNLSLSIPNDPPLVVAEVACNHAGDIKTAEKLIDLAAAAGCAVVKFQKRDVEASREKWEKIPRNDAHAFGDNEYEHRKALEFGIDVHAYLRDYCKNLGITYGCSAWDAVSAEQLHQLGVPWIKIPSAKNQEYLSWTIAPEAEVHVSLGMLNGEEREQVVASGLAERDRVVFYTCTSAYPSENEDAFLLDLPALRHRVGGMVGFSGHHKGIQLDVAAALLGASYIERHITLDRTAKGTDHAASLGPDGIVKLVRDLKCVWSALKRRPAELLACEVKPRKKLKGT